MCFGPPLAMDRYSLFIITALQYSITSCHNLLTHSVAGHLGSFQWALLCLGKFYKRSSTSYLVNTCTHACRAHTEARSCSVMRCAHSPRQETPPASQYSHWFTLPQAESEGSGCLYLHKHWVYFIFLLSFHFSFLVLNNFLVYNLRGINCTLLKCKTQWVWKLHTHACARTHIHTHTGNCHHNQETVLLPPPFPCDPLQSSLLSTLFLLSTLSLQIGLHLLEFYIEMESCSTYSFVWFHST